MDESPGDSRPVDPAIRAILERAERMTGDEVVDLARRYDARRAVDGVDRRRVLDVARRRARRGDELRALEAAVGASLHGVAPGPARRALLRLGILDAAERAILDAVMAEALRDRLGADVAEALRQPWMEVA
jgi:hypothetical protein